MLITNYKVVNLDSMFKQHKTIMLHISNMLKTTNKNIM